MEQKDKSVSESRALDPEQVLSILLLSHVSKHKVFHSFGATLKLVLNFRLKAQTQSQYSFSLVRNISCYCWDLKTVPVAQSPQSWPFAASWASPCCCCGSHGPGPGSARRTRPGQRPTMLPKGSCHGPAHRHSGDSARISATGDSFCCSFQSTCYYCSFRTEKFMFLENVSKHATASSGRSGI